MNSQNNPKLTPKIIERISPYLWYKYFYKKPIKAEFNTVQFPKVNKKFS